MSENTKNELALVYHSPDHAKFDTFSMNFFYEYLFFYETIIWFMFYDCSKLAKIVRNIDKKTFLSCIFHEN